MEFCKQNMVAYTHSGPGVAGGRRLVLRVGFRKCRELFPFDFCKKTVSQKELESCFSSLRIWLANKTVGARFGFGNFNLNLFRWQGKMKSWHFPRSAGSLMRLRASGLDALLVRTKLDAYHFWLAGGLGSRHRNCWFLDQDVLWKEYILISRGDAEGTCPAPLEYKATPEWTVYTNSMPGQEMEGITANWNSSENSRRQNVITWFGICPGSGLIPYLSWKTLWEL